MDKTYNITSHECGACVLTNITDVLKQLK